MKMTIAALMVFLVAFYLIQRWNWDECRKVGHGVLYCLVSK